MRTDYSTGSNDAWTAFCSALHDAERDFFADQTPSPPVATSPTDDDNDDSDDSDDASSTDDDEPPSFALFAPLSDPAQFNDISNLRALRLFFDVSVRAITQQPVAQHRLSELRGLQETYDARGRTIWIFDVRSRSDGSVRLVSEAGDVAT